MSRRKLQYTKTLGYIVKDSSGNLVGQSQLAGNVDELVLTFPRENVHATRNAARELMRSPGELGTRPISERKEKLVEGWFEKKK